MVNLIEQRKIKEYGIQERDIVSGQTINYILALLGISTQANDGKSLHYLAVEDLMLTEYQNFTFEEIKEAFKMLVKGNFSNEIKTIYNKLDCILFGKVMEMYKEEKVRITSNYYSQVNKKILELQQWKNEPTEEEKLKLIKNGIIESYNYFLENNSIEAGRLYVFEIFKEKNMLEEYKEKWSDFLKKAKVLKKNEIKNDVTAPNYKYILKEIEETGNVPGSVTKAKELILIDFFNKLKSKNINAEKLLKIYEK